MLAPPPNLSFLVQNTVFAHCRDVVFEQVPSPLLEELLRCSFMVLQGSTIGSPFQEVGIAFRKNPLRKVVFAVHDAAAQEHELASLVKPTDSLVG